MKRGKVAVLAVAAALGMTALAATPAIAAPGDPIELQVANTTFQAGNWGTGIEYTVTFPEGVTEAYVNVGSMGQNGGGLIADQLVTDTDGDGVETGVIVPTTSPIAPDATGFPVYVVDAYYQYDDGTGMQYISADQIQLTITEGAAVTGPAEATIADLAAGVAVQLSGFAEGEDITGAIEWYSTDTNQWRPIGTIPAGEITIDAAGNGEVLVSIYGDVIAGDLFRVVFNGASGQVEYYVTAIANTTNPTDPTTPTVPSVVDTAAK